MKVAEAIRRAGLVPVADSDLNSTVDFVIDTEARAVGVVVKDIGRPSSEYVRMILRRAQLSLPSFDDVVVVIPAVPAALRQWSGHGMHVVDLRAFRSYLDALRNEAEPTMGERDTSA